MFNTSKTDAVSQEILTEIKGLSKKVAALEGKRDQISEKLDLATKIVALEKEKVSKEIELDRVEEKHAREKR